MGRHSALVSYLLVVLLAICGRISVPGGNLLGGGGDGSDSNDPRTWRTVITDIPAINIFRSLMLPSKISATSAMKMWPISGAAPRNRLGGYRAEGSIPPDRVRPEGVTTRL